MSLFGGEKNVRDAYSRIPLHQMKHMPIEKKEKEEKRQFIQLTNTYDNLT
jgi:hypothetical protein